MANVSRVNGFKPIKHIDGSPFNGQLTTYFVPASDATAIGIGDLVKFAAVSDANGVRGVTKCAVGDPSIGAVCGVNFNPLNLNLPEYRAASTAGYVLVSDAPDVVYEAQVNGILAATSFSKNFNHVDAGVSTTTGFSGEQIDNTTVATTATLTLKMVGAKVSPDNDITVTAPKAYVIINNHQLSGGTGTAGV
jgi:hypothetical protein